MNDLNNDDLKHLAAITALNHMMRGDYFSIRPVKKAAELMDRPANGASFNVLDALDFVYFKEMPPELRDRIPGLIEDALGASPHYQFTNVRSGREIDIDMSASRSRQRRNPILRLLGR